ncbi:UDP-glycosyltransferase [Lutibacter sp. Hel_I_33_5]|uniref:UDP-glycosyltransferase n=1 Tax=Lutibacter sp. Hel_I_33_5 TaxID=1566289 RepID=UPI0011A0A372|nr:UDP-glycosyltransferase [Lutibacter sp. Hel_I_33_5]
MKKKVLILLPDGIGLRNFAYSDFYNKLSKQNSVLFWNNTEFPLKQKLNINEFPLINTKTHNLTDIIKTAKNKIELKLNSIAFKDEVYLSYIFKNKIISIKTLLKKALVNFFVTFYNSKKGIEKLNKYINYLERKTILYRNALEQLKEINPGVVFCTNQRNSVAIAPILAAKDLHIKTITFIYSWDNLPKATLVIEPDYYFVWSDFMRDELKMYYPQIKYSQIRVTGSPQFELHFDKELEVKKKSFFIEYNLDLDKKYLCFSGDDVTTSPYDEYYLEDLAKTVVALNKEGNNLGIIYRKCPVDFTGRQNKIIDKYKDVIFPIDPMWNDLGNSWNKVMPLKRDLELLTNTIKFSEIVINVGSSMVFDAVAKNKPCAYINYNTNKGDVSKWDINKIYKFIHFKSMPSSKAVLWINKKDDLKKVILDSLNGQVSLNETKKWFDKIVKTPQNQASENIVKEINKILNEKN